MQNTAKAESYTKPGGGVGGLPYKKEEDACRLALGCKLQILVFLRVFGMESNLPIQVSLSTVHKKIYKNALTLAS